MTCKINDSFSCCSLLVQQLTQAHEGKQCTSTSEFASCLGLINVVNATIMWKQIACMLCFVLSFHQNKSASYNCVCTRKIPFLAVKNHCYNTEGNASVLWFSSSRVFQICSLPFCTCQGSWHYRHATHCRHTILQKQVVCIVEVNIHGLPNFLTKFVDKQSRRCFFFHTN